MIGKIENLVLTYPHADPTFAHWEHRINRNPYPVKRVYDSIEYVSGQLLQGEELERLAGAADWRVVIKENETG